MVKKLPRVSNVVVVGYVGFSPWMLENIYAAYSGLKSQATAMYLLPYFSTLTYNYFGSTTLWSMIDATGEMTRAEMLEFYYGHNAQMFMRKALRAHPTGFCVLNAPIELNLLNNKADIVGYFDQQALDDLMEYLAGLYTAKVEIFAVEEFHLYGSSRLGVHKTKFTLVETDEEETIIFEAEVDMEYKQHYIGQKGFELSNHLGNVLVVVTDRPIPVEDTLVSGTVGYFEAEIISISDYYAFGAIMPGRNYNAGDYEYGFNGKRMDNEIKGIGNSVDFGSRIYDPRTGKFLSIDPRWKEFPANSPFCYAANNPVRLVDVEGEGPGDPIFSFGFKSDFSFKATTSVGIFASVTWKQTQVGFNSISMEGGARGELNLYSRKWGNGGVGVDGSAQAFFGVSVGPNMTPAYRGFVNGGHQFAGSGVGSTSSSGTIGWNQTFQFGSNVSGENINQRIGGPYLRGDWKSGSLLVSHLNDMWGDGRDGYDGANGHATYTNFGANTWQAGYSFQIVTPQPNFIGGDVHNRETSLDGKSYVTSNSNVNYFQESSLNFQMQTNSGVLGGGLTSRGNWTQGFWQNHVAHKDGNLYPIFKNTGTSGFKPGFKLNYTSPLFKKQ
ncbi:MAG: hypothetical protein M0R38_03020 [Bacteroidia bacterium]|nr:hypothetical protein [Bacteroidia bacterium]